MRALKLQHDEDPATKLRRAIGDISWLRLFGPKVLVATYDPGAGGGDVVTEGGIILAKSDEAGVLAEYRWQSKVGLVLAVGPLAFTDSEDGKVRFSGMRADPGQWCVYRASDGMQMMLDDNHARVLEDVHIIAVIPDPDRVY